MNYNKARDKSICITSANCNLKIMELSNRLRWVIYIIFVSPVITPSLLCACILTHSYLSSLEMIFSHISIHSWQRSIRWKEKRNLSAWGLPTIFVLNTNITASTTLVHMNVFYRLEALFFQRLCLSIVHLLASSPPILTLTFWNWFSNTCSTDNCYYNLWPGGTLHVRFQHQLRQECVFWIRWRQKVWQ